MQVRVGARVTETQRSHLFHFPFAQNLCDLFDLEIQAIHLCRVTPRDLQTESCGRLGRPPSLSLPESTTGNSVLFFFTETWNPFFLIVTIIVIIIITGRNRGREDHDHLL